MKLELIVPWEPIKAKGNGFSFLSFNLCLILMASKVS